MINLNITIIAVGKLKEKYLKEAFSEYQKRLQNYCTFHMIEVADEPTKEQFSEKEADILLQKESLRIMKQIKATDYVIALEIKGEQLSSEAFAEKICTLQVSGKSAITYVIGGSIGLHFSITQRADASLSFSKMTFPHQLMRVILAEQIYRGFRIINGHAYHK